MKSITLASIVFILSFCLNLVAGKNLPYKRSPSAGAKDILVEVEDTEDNNASSLSLASSLRSASSLSSASGLRSASSSRFLLSGNQGEDYYNSRGVKKGLDVNADGSVTRKELLRGITKAWKEVGMTYKKRQEKRPRARKLFKLFDKNGNGKLNSKEFRRFFKRFKDL